VSVGLPVGVVTGSTRAVVSNLLLQALRVESNSGYTSPSEDMATNAEPQEGSTPVGEPPSATVDPESLCLDAWQWAHDAGVADGSWRADAAEFDSPEGGTATEDAAPTTDAISAVALAIALGGGAGAHRTEQERRSRRGVEV
jgi:hypothetical protein